MSTVTSLPANIDECPVQTTNIPERVPAPQGSLDSTLTDTWFNTSDLINDFSSSKTQSSKKGKSKEYDDSLDIEIRRTIISSIEEMKKTPDAVDGFLLQIGNRLRTLPPPVEIKMLTDLFELKSSLQLY